MWQCRYDRLGSKSTNGEGNIRRINILRQILDKKTYNLGAVPQIVSFFIMKFIIHYDTIYDISQYSTMFSKF